MTKHFYALNKNISKEQQRIMKENNIGVVISNILLMFIN